MDTAYDWFARQLTSAPLLMQALMLLGLLLPPCSAAAVGLLRTIDLIFVGHRLRRPADPEGS